MLNRRSSEGRGRAEDTAAEIAAGSVTFTLTSVGSAVCAPISDQVKPQGEGGLLFLPEFIVHPDHKNKPYQKDKADKQGINQDELHAIFCISGNS